MIHEVTTAEQVADLVRGEGRVRIVGGGTKSAISSSANVSLAGLVGVLQYEPAEFTFTALAGTRLSEVQQMLAEKQQYLPFDPPLVDAGATLGGTVAAGLSGSGRFRYGGVRDFLLGVRLVTGSGEDVSLGGKVVKNAAGFDFPKLMIGSLGQFGVMTELTFKVFPAPQSSATVVFEVGSVNQSLDLMRSLATSQFDLTCLDLDASHRVWARLAGLSESVEQRARRVLQFAKGRGTVVAGEKELDFWHECREFLWVPPGHRLVKGAITPGQIADFVAAFAGLPYRISAGGHLAWLAWPDANTSEQLDDMIRKVGFSAVALTGDWPSPWLGKQHDQMFAKRLLTVLDPCQKFNLNKHAAA